MFFFLMLQINIAQACEWTFGKSDLNNYIPVIVNHLKVYISLYKKDSQSAAENQRECLQGITNYCHVITM